MTIKDYVAFAEDQDNWGKFILKEMEVAVVEPDENGNEVRQRAVFKVEMAPDGRLIYSPYDEVSLEQEKEMLATKLEKLEQFAEEAKKTEVIRIPVPVKEEEPVEEVPAALEGEVIS